MRRTIHVLGTPLNAEHVQVCELAVIEVAMAGIAVLVVQLLGLYSWTRIWGKM